MTFPTQLSPNTIYNIYYIPLPIRQSNTSDRVLEHRPTLNVSGDSNHVLDLKDIRPSSRLGWPAVSSGFTTLSLGLKLEVNSPYHYDVYTGNVKQWHESTHQNQHGTMFIIQKGNRYEMLHQPYTTVTQYARVLGYMIRPISIRR